MFTRQSCKDLRVQLQEALDPLAAELGTTAKIASMSYSDTSVSVKLEITACREDGENWRNTPDARAWALYCFRGDMQPDDLGRTYESQRGTMTIVGWKPRATRFPVLIMDTAGVIYKAPARDVKFRLDSQSAGAA